jgi:hypothetical protein
MSMRSLVAGLILLATVLGHATPGSARETNQGEEVALALGALGLNLVYVPVKAVMAVGGVLVGSLVGIATGGDVRSAYAFWVPAASGTFVLRAGNMDGSAPIQFFGSDYADKPSPLAVTEGGEGGTIYQSLYR